MKPDFCASLFFIYISSLLRFAFQPSYTWASENKKKCYLDFNDVREMMMKKKNTRKDQGFANGPWTVSGHPWAAAGLGMCVGKRKKSTFGWKKKLNSHNNGSPIRLGSHHKNEQNNDDDATVQLFFMWTCRAVMRWTFLLHLFVSTYLLVFCLLGSAAFVDRCCPIGRFVCLSLRPCSFIVNLLNGETEWRKNHQQT